jgi:hypothetical protein
MRWRVKKGGKLYSRGYWNVVGADWVGALEGSVVEGVMDGARVVPDGVREGAYEVDILVVWS